MDPIAHWKHVITMANNAFTHDHFALAAGLYQHAAGVMTNAWPYYVEKAATYVTLFVVIANSLFPTR